MGACLGHRKVLLPLSLALGVAAMIINSVYVSVHVRMSLMRFDLQAPWRRRASHAAMVAAMSTSLTVPTESAD